MRFSRRRIRNGVRRGAALLLLLVLLGGMAPAETAGGNSIESMTGETQETLAAIAVARKKGTDEDLENITIRQNGQVYGRGISGEPSGAEPKYIGLVGYAAVANNRSISLETEGTGLPWTVPAYLVYSNRWYYTRALQHKTGVLVVNQVLSPEGGGVYTGRLKVIRLDTGEICWMDVENFVTVPYWFYPARRAVKYGNTVAVYRRRGDRRPTDEDGKAAGVPDGVNVLIPGSGVWDRKAPDGAKMIPGVIYEETITEKNGKEIREPVPRVLLFPEEDLTMIY